jgi:hypothetical protein
VSSHRIEIIHRRYIQVYASHRIEIMHRHKIQVYASHSTKQCIYRQQAGLGGEGRRRRAAQVWQAGQPACSLAQHRCARVSPPVGVMPPGVRGRFHPLVGVVAPRQLPPIPCPNGCCVVLRVCWASRALADGVGGGSHLPGSRTTRRQSSQPFPPVGLKVIASSA